jgi:alkylation response protein AidB-like acyl-CoA dehydrogenase
MEKEILRGGQFLVKETSCENIFTPEDFNEDQLMMKEAVTEFVDREIWAKKAQFEQKDYALTESCMRQAGELGFLSISVPEAYGGMGMGFVDTCLVCDYISGATGSFSTAFGAHTGIGTMPITLYGNEEQKQKYVPKLASGEWFGSYCLTEPSAGSDANSGKTNRFGARKLFKITLWNFESSPRGLYCMDCYLSTVRPHVHHVCQGTRTNGRPRNTVWYC